MLHFIVKEKFVKLFLICNCLYKNALMLPINSFIQLNQKGAWGPLSEACVSGQQATYCRACYPRLLGQLQGTHLPCAI